MFEGMSTREVRGVMIGAGIAFMKGDKEARERRKAAEAELLRRGMEALPLLPAPWVGWTPEFSDTMIARHPELSDVVVRVEVPKGDDCGIRFEVAVLGDGDSIKCGIKEFSAAADVALNYK